MSESFVAVEPALASARASVVLLLRGVFVNGALCYCVVCNFAMSSGYVALFFKSRLKRWFSGRLGFHNTTKDALFLR